MPRIVAITNRDEKGRITRAVIIGSPGGTKIVDGRHEPIKSELTLEIDAHGIKIRVDQATNNGVPIASDYWKPGEMLLEHPDGVRALRNILTALLDRLDDERYENA
jgi:hypothetical protein